MPMLAVITMSLLITRIGCLLFGCDFGARVGADAPSWLRAIAIKFPNWATSFPDLTRRHATGTGCAGAIDGQMGPSTEKALRDFQQANGIPQSGVLDQKTLEALGVDENGIQSGAASASQNSGTSASQNGGVSAYPKSGASASGAIGTRS